MSDTRRPSFPELVDWVEGRLAAPRADQVAAHVETDAQLQDSVVWIRQFFALADEAPLVQPPEQVRSALRAVFRERAQAPHTAEPTRLVLLFDSRRNHTMTAVRSVDTDGGVHLAYTGEAADLVLDVYDASDATARIEGQLLLRDAQPNRVVVTVRGADHEVTHLSVDDPLGRFTLDGVRTGPTELCIRASDIDMCADLDLSRPPDEL